MSEIIEYSLRKREEDIKRILQDASLFIVWPCEEGVLVLAANKDRRENRTHSIFDRIACITLGGFSAGTILWQDAALRASMEGFNLSRGDVSCRILIKGTSALLSESFHNFRQGPVFGAEVVFVEVASERADDYLAYVNFRGFIQTFNEAKMFGRIQVPDVRDVRNEGRAENELAHQRIKALWEPDLSTEQAIDSLRQEQSLANIFSSTRVEAILLDRKMVKEEKFNKTFKRLAI